MNSHSDLSRFYQRRLATPPRPAPEIFCEISPALFDTPSGYAVLVSFQDIGYLYSYRDEPKLMTVQNQTRTITLDEGSRVMTKLGQFVRVSHRERELVHGVRQGGMTELTQSQERGVTGEVVYVVTPRQVFSTMIDGNDYEEDYPCYTVALPDTLKISGAPLIDQFGYLLGIVTHHDKMAWRVVMINVLEHACLHRHIYQLGLRWRLVPSGKELLAIIIGGARADWQDLINDPPTHSITGVTFSGNIIPKTLIEAIWKDIPQPNMGLQLRRLRDGEQSTRSL